MTVGFYSPLPPAKSGVADYSMALLAALKGRAQIKLNADGDINLYHLGNNQLHAPIYVRALERPGIVVLHDAVLQHFALGYFSHEQYVEEFVYNYGEWNRALGQSLWRNRSRSAADSGYFRYPMLKRVVERSRAVIVHNAAAAAMVRAHAAVNVIEIPLLYKQPIVPHAVEVEQFRAQFEGRRVFGVLGFLRESKRVMAILRTFAKLPDCGLLLAGEAGSTEFQAAIEPYLQLPNIKRLGFLPEKEYWRAALAMDACINLRYPAAGESSAISVGLMAAGQAVMMTDSLENSAFPESACLKISSGVSEAAELYAHVLWASIEGRYLREMGSNAARFITANHSIEKVAALYWQALNAH